MAGIAQSQCSPTDTACICTDKELTAAITECVAVKCTIREALTTQNVSYTTCGAPIRDRSHLVSGFGAGGGAVALIVYFVRIFAKYTVPAATFGYDDLSITIAMALGVVFSVLSLILTKNGYGKDIWTIPFDHITEILKIYYIDEVVYIITVSMTKVAILCFYLRVFPEMYFRRLVLIAMAATIAYMIAFVLVSALQCQPVSLAWTHWDGEHEGHCNNVNAQGWAAAGTNIALDVAIIVMPLGLISRLNLHWKKKLQISIMLSVGVFVTIVSILRLDTLFSFAKSSNVSYDGVPFGYWSSIELHVGIICACMPALYSLFKHYFPQVFGGGTVRGKSTKGSTKGSNTGRSSRGASPAIHLDFQKDDNKDNFHPLVDVESIRGDSRPGVAL
ncbi:hypothetical protein LTS17_005504 [Exophiala oligosperma]